MSYNDLPIKHPHQDLYHLAPFASAVATSIARISATDGVVIVLHGAWGTGKSSVVNLAVNYLKKQDKLNSIKIFRFNPWWISDSEQLAVRFFAELSIVISRSFPTKLREVRKLVSRIASAVCFRAAPIIAAFGASALGAPTEAAAATSAVVDAAAKAASTRNHHPTDTLDETYRKLRKLLKSKSDQRILCIIDDVDRLTPDHAVLMFRLLKSVGQLPNILYLVCCDKVLLANQLNHSFGNGKDYLEKIFQIEFAIPPTGSAYLRSHLIALLKELSIDISESDQPRFWDTYFDVIKESLRLPRDVVRLSNALNAGWHPVKDEVDAIDYIAIESIRLFDPLLYKAIADNQSELCGSGSLSAKGKSQDNAAHLDEIFLAHLSTSGQKQVGRIMLQRLFPCLKQVWSNRQGGDWNADELRKKRRVASHANFPAYFRMSLGSEAVSAHTIRRFYEVISDEVLLKEFILRLARSKRKSGLSDFRYFVEELTAQADDVNEKAIPILLKVLFNEYDSLPEDEERVGGMFTVGNDTRIQWLLNKLVRDAFEHPQRSRLLAEALAGSSLRWHVELVRRCASEARPTNERGPLQPTERLMTDTDLSIAVHDAVEGIRTAVETGELLKLREPVWFLWRWRELDPDAHDAVRDAIAKITSDDHAVCVIAESMVQESTTHSEGQRVARTREIVNRAAARKLLDADALLIRVDEVLHNPETSPDVASRLKRFLEAWHRDSRY